MIQTMGGLALLKIWEGHELVVFLDTSGIATVGYGHLTDLPVGTLVTDAQATAWFLADLAPTMARVAALVGPATSDRQYSAMVSLTFNIGRGGFLTSTVLRQHLAGNYAAAADAFLLWDKDHRDGVLVEVPGLLNRRNAERLLYMTPDTTS